MNLRSIDAAADGSVILTGILGEDAVAVTSGEGERNETTVELLFSSHHKFDERDKGALLGEGREVAAAVVFLATDAPESMSGCILDVNGASYLRT